MPERTVRLHADHEEKSGRLGVRAGQMLGRARVFQRRNVVWFTHRQPHIADPVLRRED